MGEAGLLLIDMPEIYGAAGSSFDIPQLVQVEMSPAITVWLPVTIYTPILLGPISTIWEPISRNSTGCQR